MTAFAWLIEAPGPKYLSARKLTNMNDFVWTDEHSKAIRFCSQAQAEFTMLAIRQLCRMAKDGLFSFETSLGPARAVEHGWITPPTPEQEAHLQGLIDSEKPYDPDVLVGGPDERELARAGITPTLRESLEAAGFTITPPKTTR